MLITLDSLLMRVLHYKHVLKKTRAPWACMGHWEIKKWCFEIQNLTVRLIIMTAWLFTFIFYCLFWNSFLFLKLWISINISFLCQRSWGVPEGNAWVSYFYVECFSTVLDQSVSFLGEFVYLLCVCMCFVFERISVLQWIFELKEYFQNFNLLCFSFCEVMLKFSPNFSKHAY